MIDDVELRQTWLAFASAAISGLGSKPQSSERKLEATANAAVAIADAMLEAYVEKFDPVRLRDGFYPIFDDEGAEEDEEDEEPPARRR